MVFDKVYLILKVYLPLLTTIVVLVSYLSFETKKIKNFALFTFTRGV